MTVAKRQKEKVDDATTDVESVPETTIEIHVPAEGVTVVENSTVVGVEILPEVSEAKVMIIVDPPKPKVPLDVFVASGSHKWDQMAGFVSYARAKKLGPLSIVEWRSAHSAFLNKPVA